MIHHKKHMARIGDLFPEYQNYKWLKGEGNLLKAYGKRNKCSLARGIFHTFIDMVMDDVVDGHHFQFPDMKGQIYVEEIPADVRRKLQDKGKLQGYEDAMVAVPAAPVYRFTSPGGKRHKFRVIFDKKRYYRLLRKLSDGHRYTKPSAVW